MFKSSIFVLTLLICLVSFNDDKDKKERSALFLRKIQEKALFEKGGINLPSNKGECIDYIVNIISSDTIAYLTRGVGAAGMPTIQYVLTDTLLNMASEKQLQETAMNHKSAVVRAAIFNALVRKYPHAAVEVAIQGLHDFTPVEVMRGCIIGTDTLSQLRIHSLIINKEYYHINDNDYNRLDSVLLFSEITKKMDSYGKLYKKLTPKPHYYQRLLDLYDKSSYTIPIIAIAKYHKAEDRKRMMELFQYVGYKKSDGLDDALQAISEWPDNAYKNYGGIGVTVCERWKRFDYFLEDVCKLPGYDEEKIKQGKLTIDKDIIDRSKLLYSPETCCFVSRSQNSTEANLRRWHGNKV